MVLIIQTNCSKSFLVVIDIPFLLENGEVKEALIDMEYLVRFEPNVPDDTHHLFFAALRPAHFFLFRAMEQTTHHLYNIGTCCFCIGYYSGPQRRTNAAAAYRGSWAANLPGQLVRGHCSKRSFHRWYGIYCKRF